MSSTLLHHSYKYSVFKLGFMEPWVPRGIQGALQGQQVRQEGQG